MPACLVQIAARTQPVEYRKRTFDQTGRDRKARVRESEQEQRLAAEQAVRELLSQKTMSPATLRNVRRAFQIREEH